MPARRPILAVAACAALLVSLAGCQKPSPGVTLVSHGSTVHFQAAAYCRDAKVLVVGDECPGTGPQVKVFRVRQGDSVGVDVDRTLAQHSWYLYDSDAQQRSAVKDSHYTTFVADFSNRPRVGVIDLEVREVSHTPASDKDLPPVIGRWRFQLVQKS
jgi:hypothetical protein